jgi:hypothetical protein
VPPHVGVIRSLLSTFIPLFVATDVVALVLVYDLPHFDKAPSRRPAP